MLGGVSTNVHMLGNTVDAFVQRTDFVQRALAEPTLFLRGMEESLRLNALGQWTGRLALEDTVVGDVPIPNAAAIFWRYSFGCFPASTRLWSLSYSLTAGA